MEYFLSLPLLLLLALLPLTLFAVAVLRSMASRWSFSPAVPLVAAVSAILTLAVLTHILFASLYLASASFTDHIEPNTAIVAWIYAQGGQIYHSIDAPERYSFLYGPVPYIATAWVYELIGTGTTPAKVAGFLCLLLTFVLIAMSAWRHFRGQLIPCIVALGYFSLLALFFKNHSFWSKADPFMIVAAAIGLYTCLMRPGRNAWLVCGIALGIAVNAKVTGALYFLPYLAWFYDRDGYRAPLVILPAAAVAALLPFLSPERISLLNYLAWLQSAGNHGVSMLLLLQNVVFILFIMTPVWLFLLWQLGSVGIRSWFARRKLVCITAFLAGLLALIAGAKPGSGPHHFLPFLPAVAFLTAHAAARVYAYRPTTSLSIYGFWAPLGAFLLAATIKAAVAAYFLINVVLSHANEVAVKDELTAILAAKPQNHIYMGYGNGDRYISTFLRTELAYAGQPYLIDLPALLDFDFSGIAIPAATIDKMLADKSAIWLIPAGEEPFTMVSWYQLDTDKLLFDERFRDAFNQNFVLIESLDYFDLYALRNGTATQ
jgi:hypothetical protein